MVLRWDQWHEKKQLSVHLIGNVLIVEFLFVSWEEINRVSRNSNDLLFLFWCCCFFLISSSFCHDLWFFKRFTQIIFSSIAYNFAKLSFRWTRSKTNLSVRWTCIKSNLFPSIRWTTYSLRWTIIESSLRSLLRHWWGEIGCCWLTSIVRRTSEMSTIIMIHFDIWIFITVWGIIRLQSVSQGLQRLQCLIIQNREPVRSIVSFIIKHINFLRVRQTFEIIWNSSKCYLFIKHCVFVENIKHVKYGVTDNNDSCNQ